MTKKMRYAAIGGVCTAFIFCFALFYGIGTFMQSLGVNNAELHREREIYNEMREYLENKYNKEFSVDGKVDEYTFQFYSLDNPAAKFCVTIAEGTFTDNYVQACEIFDIKKWFSDVMLNDYFCNIVTTDADYRVTIIYTGNLNTSLFMSNCDCANFTASLYQVSEDELFSVRASNTLGEINATKTYRLLKYGESFRLEDLR